jgi:hypothetical protein
MQVVQNSKVVSGATQIDVRFLERLANRRVDQGLVFGLLAPTRKRNMPAPWITLVLGALNEKELGLSRLAEADEDRNGCASRQRVVDLDRGPRRQRSVKPRYSLVATKPFELIHT